MKFKALSVQNPWAYDIIACAKEDEYRSKRTHYRGDVLICASARPQYKSCYSGHALGIAELYDCVFDKGEQAFAWKMRNPRVLKRPFPVKGKLGFYEVDLPDDLLDGRISMWELWLEPKDAPKDITRGSQFVLPDLPVGPLPHVHSLDDWGAQFREFNPEAKLEQVTGVNIIDNVGDWRPKLYLFRATPSPFDNGTEFCIVMQGPL